MVRGQLQKERCTAALGGIARWLVADYGPAILQSSYRNVVPSGERDVIYGFRCVIDLDAAQP